VTSYWRDVWSFFAPPSGLWDGWRSDVSFGVAALLLVAGVAWVVRRRQAAHPGFWGCVLLVALLGGIVWPFGVAILLSGAPAVPPAALGVAIGRWLRRRDDAGRAADARRLQQARDRALWLGRDLDSE
jgi:hypothetical protein